MNAWLATVLVLLLVAAPVIWIMPTRAQRRQAALRETARQAGLQVRLEPMPQTRRQRVREKEPAGAAAYRLMRPREQLEAAQSENWRMLRDGAGGWEQQSVPAARAVQLQAIVESLPMAVKVLEATPLDVAIYWREQGEADEVRELAALLREVRDA